MDAIIIYFSIISQYSEGMMLQVIENRQSGNAWVSLPEVLPRTDGYIAVLDCAELENVWWVENPDGVWESMLIVDCARKNDGTPEWFLENNVAMEVDYQTAERWGTVGKLVKARWAKSCPAGCLGEAGGYICQ